MILFFAKFKDINMDFKSIMIIWAIKIVWIQYTLQICYDLEKRSLWRKFIIWFLTPIIGSFSIWFWQGIEIFHEVINTIEFIVYFIYTEDISFYQYRWLFIRILYSEVFVIWECSLKIQCSYGFHKFIEKKFILNIRKIDQNIFVWIICL